MTRSTDFSVSKPSLNGKVFCANCDAEMANTGQRYYCPNNAADSDSNCLSKPVSAHNLNRVVISTMVERTGKRGHRTQNHRKHKRCHRGEPAHPALENGAGRGADRRDQHPQASDPPSGRTRYQDVR